MQTLFRGLKDFGAARNIEEGGSLTIIQQHSLIPAAEWMRLYLRNLRVLVIQS